MLVGEVFLIVPRPPPPPSTISCIGEEPLRPRDPANPGEFLPPSLPPSLPLSLPSLQPFELCCQLCDAEPEFQFVCCWFELFVLILLLLPLLLLFPPLLFLLLSSEGESCNSAATFILNPRPRFCLSIVGFTGEMKKSKSTLTVIEK